MGDITLAWWGVTNKDIWFAVFIAAYEYGLIIIYTERWILLLDYMSLLLVISDNLIIFHLVVFFIDK